jgi:hypothetical protein
MNVTEPRAPKIHQVSDRDFTKNRSQLQFPVEFASLVGLCLRIYGVTHIMALFILGQLVYVITSFFYWHYNPL